MTTNTPYNPLIIQNDLTVLIEVDSSRYAAALSALARFAELVKSPEHVQTYRITALSIWNACAVGVTTEEIVQTLHDFSKHEVPPHVAVEIRDFASRYGRLRLSSDGRGLVLAADDQPLAETISRNKHVAPLLGDRLSPLEFHIDALTRGRLKQELIKFGFHVEDVAGYRDGETLPIALRRECLSGEPFAVRAYQQAAVDTFYVGGSSRGGSGVIVLPCGTGKTVVGIGCMADVQASTLILTTSVTASRQWIAEILDKTSLQENQIGEYSSTTKDVRPVTVATYNMMIYRPPKDDDFVHLELFDRRDWGLIIYDEVHMLPAPVFQVTAGLQARRRLGLTATLVREDGREDDVFALIGPKRVDIPWKMMENQGWIASARCTEIRLALPEEIEKQYAVANNGQKFRIASENPLKTDIVKHLLAKHRKQPTLIIGMYVDQIRGIAKELGVPVLTGSTSQRKRDALFEDFKAGRLDVLVVSKVANFAVDLPDASVAIEISGMFGSRQEEAQRLGRILRPKPGDNQAHFYTVVSRDTVEQDYALKRQLFLREQGYAYEIRDVDENDISLDP